MEFINLGRHIYGVLPFFPSSSSALDVVLSVENKNEATQGAEAVQYKQAGGRGRRASWFYLTDDVSLPDKYMTHSLSCVEAMVVNQSIGRSRNWIWNCIYTMLV